MSGTVLAIVVLALWGVGWWKIFSRAGYPGLASVTMFIPIVNVVAFLWLAFLPWPIQDQLEEELASKGADPQP